MRQPGALLGVQPDPPIIAVSRLRLSGRCAPSEPMNVPGDDAALHVPGDAGEHAAGLERILRRIPPRWGRWISCASGWYPILVELDTAIAAVIPDYEVHQVKEKFGGLRYYSGPPPTPWPCCTQFAADHPHPEMSLHTLAQIERSGRELTDDEQAARERTLAWRDLQAAHVGDVEHQTRLGAARAAGEVVQALIRAAEQRCAVTCERCGRPGALTARAGWYQTLCPVCAAAAGATALGDDDGSGCGDDVA